MSGRVAGATIAYACLIRGVANSVTLYDVNADKTRAGKVAGLPEKTVQGWIDAAKAHE